MPVQKFDPPQPSELFLELKSKYRIQTEYLKKLSPNYKNRCWDILRFWLRILEEKISQNEGEVSFEIYKRCKNELEFVPRYELRFLCEVCRLFHGVNEHLTNLVWEDILLKIDEKGHTGDFADPLPVFIELAFDLNRIDSGNKLFFINVIANTLNQPNIYEKLNLDIEALEKYLKILKKVNPA
jgi:hypothetical protein